MGQGKTAHAVAGEFDHEQVLRLLMERSPDSLKLAVACVLGGEALLERLRATRPGLPPRSKGATRC